MRTKLTYTDTVILDLDVSAVVWAAPGARQFGTADFTIPRNHPSLSFATLGSYLRSDGKGGSLVEIETPALGLWRGISSDPVWSAKEGCKVHAMQLPFLMGQRIVFRSRVFVGLTAGAIFSAAVQDAIAGIGGQVLRPGTFCESAPVVARYEFRGQTLAQVGNDLYQMTGQEWRLADDGSINWVPPHGTLYGTLLCDDGDITDVVKSVAGSEGAGEVIARDAAGREFIATSGSTSLLARQQLVSVSTSGVGAAGLAAMQALAIAGNTPASYTARLKSAHWSVREGDFSRIASPYTAPGGETFLGRLMTRSFRDGDALLSTEWQFIDPIDAQASMRLIGDLGTMSPPPPVKETQTDVSQIVNVMKDDLAKVQVQLNALQTKVG